MNNTEQPEISIVVPIFSEVDNVKELHREIVEACRTAGCRYEIIFVDDGSTDGTGEVLKELSPLVTITMRRNFGQTAAMDAGIKQAKYRYIVTMDGDRQNDPADIPRLVEEIEKSGKDVVSGWRRKRKDPFMKRFVSRGAHALRRMMIRDGIHDSGCSLKIYRRECFTNVNLYGEMHRFIPAVLKIKGFSIGEVEVNHRPRTSGRTKYNWKRSVKGFLDMLSVWFWNKYAVRPLHFLGGLGILCILFGFVFSGIGIVFYLQGNNLFRNVLPVAAVFMFITGVQLFVSGLMADMLAKTYFASTRDVSYSIKSVEVR
jgi:glycosyltransferase involved in cell wall biosynthesis